MVVDHADALFDSTYLRWFHLNDYPSLCEIIRVERDVEMTLPGGRQAKRPVLHLKQLEGKISEIKPLVLNVTNKDLIKGMHGPKPSQWPGKRIVLYQTTTDLRGKPTDCIRIRPPKEKK